ncbi:MAG: hypothetical protein AAF541_06915 [Pseudomonadota bacterium]
MTWTAEAGVQVDCSGEGPVTYVISGTVVHAGVKYELSERLAELGRTCVAHITDPDPRDTQEVGSIDALRVGLNDALRAAQAPSPYVLIGFGSEGMLSMLFAQTYLFEVQGLVLVNMPLPGGSRSELSDNRTFPNAEDFLERTRLALFELPLAVLYTGELEAREYSPHSNWSGDQQQIAAWSSRSKIHNVQDRCRLVGIALNYAIEFSQAPTQLSLYQEKKSP